MCHRHAGVASATCGTARSGAAVVPLCRRAAEGAKSQTHPVAASASRVAGMPAATERAVPTSAIASTGGNHALSAPENPMAAELKAAIDATRLASRLCMSVQQKLTDGERQDKSDDSPVTVADYGAQALVAWALRRASPDGTISMVAEEDSGDLRTPEGADILRRITALVNETIQSISGTPDERLSEEDVLELIDLGCSQGGAEGSHWVLDPIDGTRGFVGKRQYAVCLGLIQSGQVVLGVLGCPNLPHRSLNEGDGGAGAAEMAGSDGVGCLFAAVRGKGSFWGPLLDNGLPSTRCRVADVEETAGAVFMQSYESRHSSHSTASTVAQTLGFKPDSLKLDSQAKYGALARGDAQAWMRFPPNTYREKIWDHAAGTIVVQEAGGVVSDGTGAPLDFGKGRYLDQRRGIIAAPPAIHKAMVSAVMSIPEN